ERPLAALLHELPVSVELPAVPEILDDVPVDCAHVRPPGEGVRVADGEMDRAVDLLVEREVPAVALDTGVAADPELAEPARALVRVEHREQERLTTARGRLDDAAAFEQEARALDLLAEPDSRKLGERD